MIDIHAHILPGVDDGSDSWETSMEMAELAVEGGTRIIMATPHANMPGRFENYESDGYCRKLVTEFRKRIEQEGLPLRVGRGMEVFGYGEIMRLIEDRELISLNGKGYFLIEFPFDLHPDDMSVGLEMVMAAGGKPVIAHPERYYCVQEDPNLVFRWRQMGVITQINKGSLFGRFGRNEERVAHELLEHNLVNCVASDAHSSRMRTPYMRDAYEYLEHEFAPEVAKLLLEENPKKILIGAAISNRDIMPIGL